MQNGLPYLDILIFAIIAIFLVFRLKNILGTKSELDETKIKSITDFLTKVKVQIFMTDIGNKKLTLSDQNSTSYNIENGAITRL